MIGQKYRFLHHFDPSVKSWNNVNQKKRWKKEWWIIFSYRLLLVPSSTFCWPALSRLKLAPQITFFVVLCILSGRQLQTNENDLKCHLNPKDHTKSKRQVNFILLSYTLYHRWGPKGTTFCNLFSHDFSRSFESIRERSLPNTVNLWGYIFRMVTTRYLEQFRSGTVCFHCYIRHLRISLQAIACILIIQTE